MTTPTKIQADTLIHHSQITYKPIDYERFEDLMEEVTKDHLVEFIK